MALNLLRHRPPSTNFRLKEQPGVTVFDDGTTAARFQLVDERKILILLRLVLGHSYHEVTKDGSPVRIMAGLAIRLPRSEQGALREMDHVQEVEGNDRATFWAYEEEYRCHAPPYVFSSSCSACGKTLEEYHGGFAQLARQSEGVHCDRCRKTWCNTCHPPASGQKCQDCGGGVAPNFARP